ncbi:uncharacterized protein LOC9655377 isoform X1 [Selaginella moellendorffii]|uniref:uncharacterized protein LOC9655377 isoform X1 n=1 Tax=Selaginella moellendorffii TaxID=88036 RepID=UPI000D1D0566|nr:uncharacterized protein LOC9655377 isoform X1 [Selaginella moellendorffii]|eukprot:XP_002965793.2 uncharacterized protein LOC9655377 isoform X1 [Selaginella moellendorffii]
MALRCAPIAERPGLSARQSIFRVLGRGSRRIGAIRDSLAFPYENVGDCLLYTAPDAMARKKKPKALVQFLGGAFIGAAPELTYSYFIELLAKQGFLIMAAPYNVTFDHELCARRIHGNWSSSLNLLAQSGCEVFGLSPSDVAELPVISVGHSNGALMQVLIGSYCIDEKLPKASAIISFNNKPAVQAVPFFDQLGPTLSSVAQGSPVMAFAEFLTEETMKAIADPPFPLPPGIERESLEPVKRFIQQIPSVFGQVADGVSEFKPTPEQNRSLISSSYAVSHTLLVKFSVDTIDETDSLEALLRPQVNKIGGTLRKMALTGTHATPLLPDLKLEAGKIYTPVDAVSQAVRKAALADVENLARKIGDWFEELRSDALL